MGRVHRLRLRARTRLAERTDAVRSGASMRRAHGRAIVAYKPTTGVERFSERLFDQQRAICEFKPPYAVSANMIASRDTLAALGVFDESFLRGQDVELSYRAFFAGRATFGYIDDAVVAHIHPRTLTALWRKALQHGEAAANIVGKYGDVLGDTHGAAALTGDAIAQSRASLRKPSPRALQRNVANNRNAVTIVYAS